MNAFRRVSLAVMAMALLVFTAALAQTEDAARIEKQAEGGVLALVIYGADKTEVGKASAMALTEDILATAYHVISQAYDVEAVSSKGKKMKIDGIVGFDKNLDVALLKLRGKVQPLTVSVSGPEALAEGARLFALGSNESGQIVVSEGTLRKYFEVGPGQKAMEIALSLPDQFSGGPIIGIGGNVQGMAILLGQQLQLGLPISAVQKVSRSGKVTEFKSWTRQDYFSLPEGATFGGRVAAALDNLSAARMHLEKAVSLIPSFTEGYWLLANVYDQERDNSLAIDAYKKVIELDPSRAAAYAGLGGVLKRVGQIKEAAEALEKAISLNIESKEIFFDLGDAYEALENWAAAASAYEKYLSLKPEMSWNGELRLGLCRAKLGQYDAAIAAYLEALKEQPADLKVNFSLAEVYEKAGQLDKAEEVYSRLAQINPAEAKTYYSQIMRMYDSAEKYDKAIGPAQKIVELDPKNESNIYNLGFMYFKLQKYDQAVEQFKQCVALKPDFATAWFQIGSSYFNEKKYAEAIEPFKKYTELVPDEPNGWLSLGVQYMFLRNFEKALEPMKRCVELKPDNPNAQYNLAIVYLNLKDNLSARDIYKKLTTLDPALAEKLKKFLR